MKLLPCPFCGKEAKIYGGYGVAYYVSCTNDMCWCSLGEMWDRDAMPDHMFGDKETAAIYWNKRTPIAQQQISGSADATQKSCYNCKKGCGIAEYKDCVSKHYSDWISRTSDI